mgnify:CR=1 FL=1
MSYFFLLIFFYNLNIVRFTAKKYLPLETRTLIKEYILGKEKVEQLRKGRELNKMNYNQKILPETQFTNMYLKEIFLKDLEPISKLFFISSIWFIKLS